MSDEEKKGGEYEKRESHEAGGNDLEDVSGGAGAGTQERCDTGAIGKH